MKFAETRLAEAISLLQKISVKPPPGDKRRSRRMSLRVGLQIHPVSDKTSGKPIQAELHDISARGLAVKIKEPMEMGSSFIVQLPVEAHDKQLLSPLICQVVHCHHQGGNTYLIGAEFIGQLDREAKRTGDLVSEEARIRNSILS